MVAIRGSWSPLCDRFERLAYMLRVGELACDR